MKKAYAKINLDAILYNYRHLKCQYEKNIIAVLKDDAYGFGAVRVAQHLKHEKGIVFAVKDIQEGKKLRQAKITNDILILGVFEKKDLLSIKKYHFQVIVTSLKQLNDLKNTSIPFHLKINTGMNRLGLSIDDFKKAFAICRHHSEYCLKGVMTHFATSDKNHYQYLKFKEALKGLDLTSLMIHCFSSYSLQKEDLTNYCRVGIRLYGLFERDLMLKNALEIESPIAHIQKVKKGDLVGYDFQYKVKTDGYVYILPLGYANGWGRFLKSYAYFENIYLEQAGTISMDYTAYFSTYKIKKDTILELVSLHVPIEQLAQNNRISIYEILTHLRLKRIYL